MRIHRIKSDIAELTREARQVLRLHFSPADMGISGVNFGVAETGSTVIVTNEGNGRLITTMPRIHVAIIGIEGGANCWKTSARCSGCCRARPPGSRLPITFPSRPEHAGGRERWPGRIPHGAARQRPHAVLGGASCRGTALHPLRRVHEPLSGLSNIGGHAYGGVYPGPIGAVLTPSYIGLENALDLPQASTMCNECGVVCPVKIPLPDLMRVLREEEFERNMRPWQERWSIKAWSWAAQRPGVYAFLARIGAKLLALLGGKENCCTSCPAWTAGPKGATCRRPTARRFALPIRKGGTDGRARKILAGVFESIFTCPALNPQQLKRSHARPPGRPSARSPPAGGLA